MHPVPNKVVFVVSALALCASLSFRLGLSIPDEVTVPVSGFQIQDCRGTLAFGYTDSKGTMFAFSNHHPPELEDVARMHDVPVEMRHIFTFPCHNNNNGASNGINASEHPDSSRHNG